MITGTMNEPTTIQAGDKLTWQETHPDYPASGGWSLQYVLINQTNKYTFSGVANGDAFDITLLSATTAAWATGTYKLFSQYVKGDDKERQPIITVTVTPDPFTVNTLDTRTHAVRALAAIEAAIEGRATSSQLSLSVSSALGSRAIQYLTYDELIKAKNYYAALVENEKQKELIAAGKAVKSGYKIEFK
jgi:hypothetical protein